MLGTCRAYIQTQTVLQQADTEAVHFAHHMSAVEDMPAGYCVAVDAQVCGHGLDICLTLK